MNLINRILLKLTFILGKPLSDETYTKIVYRLKMGKKLNLNNPQTFNEKLQWLKLYDHNPLYTTLVDKYAVKDYVKNIIGDVYIIPTLGVWEKPEEIEWDNLPNQFVLKTTHGGGGDGVFICKDKSSLDIATTIIKLKNALKTNPYKRLREWPYKNVPHKIIAEQYMEDTTNPNSDLTDYKFYCFNGEPKYCQIIRDRNTKETIDFYDMEWNLQEFVGLNPKCKNGDTLVEKPDYLQDMISICNKLSQCFPFVRVDLYNIDSKIYFGELTFYPYGGMGNFSPNGWDYTFGSWVKIPHK